MSSTSTARVARPLILCSIASVGLLSACAPHIQLSQAALPCGELVDSSGLLKATPPAALPANSEASRWVAFSDIQTGQLDRANSDKQAVTGILHTCDQWQNRPRTVVTRVKDVPEAK